MRKLILKELTIMSPQDKKAKKIKFDKRRTLIKGPNSTGKSSLIKSIYKTLGAEAYKVNKTWQDINPYTLIKFEVEEKSYTILQIRNHYSVFDSNDELIDTYDSVTKGLTPFLANILDFQLKIIDKRNETITPPSQYMFLPYYIDQDIGWTDSWSSFSNLTQLSNWRDDLVSYFAGIKPNEYYELKSEINNKNNDKNELSSERKILNSALEKIESQAPIASFNLDMNSFKDEIEKLVLECQSIQKIQIGLKDRLLEYYNLKASILDQIEITKAALKESNLDYKFASEELTDQVDCPICGARYENSFAERFSIAKDEDRCRELLITLEHELADVENKIDKEKQKFDNNMLELKEITTLLDSKKETVQLNDILKIEGRKEIGSAITSQIEKIDKNLSELEKLIREFKKKLNTYIDPERKKEIEEKYHKYMQNYLYNLKVELDSSAYRRINCHLKTTGSELPRALLAYYFSVLGLMSEYSSSVFCPIIIDSPNQQAQDKDNIRKILEFIKNNQPQDTQLILGLEDDLDIDFECPIINLTEPYGLLTSKDYEEVSKEIGFYFEQTAKTM